MTWTVSWAEQLQKKVRGAEFYGPRDAGNPVPGSWAVLGPLSEYRDSSISIEHAAQLYLAQVCRDPDAIAVFRTAARRAGRVKK